MSVIFSRKMAGVATRLFDKYGSTVTLVRAGSKVWNSSLGEGAAASDSQSRSMSAPVPVNTSSVDGTTIQAGDMIVKADYSVVPSMEDKVQFGGEQGLWLALRRRWLMTISWLTSFRYGNEFRFGRQSLCDKGEEES